MPQPYPFSSPATVPPHWADELSACDERWHGGDHLDATELTATLDLWRARLQRPPARHEEWLDIVDAGGETLGLSAPRWFCHLTGLRHRVVHVYFTTPQGLLILQRRARNKSQWPDLFDTSVGGHIKAGQGWLGGLLAEIEEELGLAAAEIDVWLGTELRQVAEPYERYDVWDGPMPLRNRQVNQLFTATLSPWGLASLRFADGEVDGVLLVTPAVARRMVADGEQVAPGLRGSFIHWWQSREQNLGAGGGTAL